MNTLNIRRWRSARRYRFADLPDWLKADILTNPGDITPRRGQ